MRKIRRIKKPVQRFRRMRGLRQAFLVGVLGLMVLPGFFIFALSDQRSLEQVPGVPPILHQSGETINVLNVETNETMTLALEDYLRGVVAAEMPAGFAPEALKAQAVAARTYAYSRLQAAEPGAVALSTDPATCQAWISPLEQEKRWGANYLAYSSKIAQAVQETQGELITYQGRPIEPLYHASCGGGRTESSKDVWGGERPYLVSVSCNHPPDKHTQTQTTLSLAQLDGRLGTHLQAIPASTGSIPQAIYTLATTNSERTKEILIDGQSFSGSALRTALGLKSTLITYQVSQDGVTFITNGYGHGVGMCQYGADYYASQGYTYQQILRHYYTDVDVVKALATTE